MEAELPITLDDLVRNVALWRHLAQSYKAQIEELERRLREEQAHVFENYDLAKNELEQAEKQLREAVVAAYEQTRDKHPHPALSVRLTTKLRYDEAQVTDWARLYMPAVLKLDTTQFNKVAKQITIPGVEVVEEPVAAVATNLADYTPPYLLAEPQP